MRAEKWSKAGPRALCKAGTAENDQTKKVKRTGGGIAKGKTTGGGYKSKREKRREWYAAPQPEHLASELNKEPA